MAHTSVERLADVAVADAAVVVVATVLASHRGTRPWPERNTRAGEGGSSTPLRTTSLTPADYVGGMRRATAILACAVVFAACAATTLSEGERQWCATHQEEVVLAHISLGLGVPIPYQQPEGYLDSAKGKRSCTKAYESR